MSAFSYNITVLFDLQDGELRIFSTGFNFWVILCKVIYNAIIVIDTDIVQEDATLREMKQRIEETETMNRVKIWHDHSVLNGHNTFIISIAFLYDTAVYLTEKESGL